MRSDFAPAGGAFLDILVRAALAVQFQTVAAELCHVRNWAERLDTAQIFGAANRG
jgi:hypothetical protein